MSIDFQDVFTRCTDLPADPLRTAIDAGLAAGLQTSQSGDTDVFDEFSTGGIPHNDGPYDIQHVIDRIESSGGGDLYFYADGRYIKFNMPNLTPDLTKEIPTFALNWSKHDILNMDIETALNWVETVATTFEVDYMFSGWDSGQIATRDPVELNYLPWILVLSPERIEKFGGRDHVLATPAWRVQELDTGRIMLVTREDPFPGADDAVEDHLFGN